MEKCMCCGQETSHTATVYLKAPGTSPVKQTEYFCGNCVKKRSGGLSSIIFYLALQLCWFTALKTGLFTPFGILPPVSHWSGCGGSQSSAAPA